MTVIELLPTHVGFEAQAIAIERTRFAKQNAYNVMGLVYLINGKQIIDTIISTKSKLALVKHSSIAR